MHPKKSCKTETVIGAIKKLMNFPNFPNLEAKKEVRSLGV